MSKNSMVERCAAKAFGLRVCTRIPSEMGVEHAGKGLGARSTSTKHIRQLAAIDNLR